MARLEHLLLAAAVSCFRVPLGGAAVPKAVIAHIRCEVCKLACKEARGHAKNNSIEEEDALTDFVENLCSPLTDEGKWMRRLDIVQEAGRLVLKKQELVGECRKECKALQQSCSKSMQGHDENMVSLLLKSAGLAKLQNSICFEACRKKSLPKLEDWKDEEFLEDKDERINNLVQDMKGMKGMKGMENLKMYKPGQTPPMKPAEL